MWQDTKNVYHLFIAVLANILYRFPSKKLKIIGVTGTDGKTTTSSLIYQILKYCGLDVSMVTSVGAIINNSEYPLGFHVTTPSPFKLQNFIRKAIAGNKPKYLVLEVTSHAIDQHRIWGIPFEVGVLTNITNEHLDYHKTYDNYLKTKAKLLKSAKTAVLNRDDKSYLFLEYIKSLKKDNGWITYGMSDNSDINSNSFPFKTKIDGDFNRYNILASIAACKAIGLEDEKIREAVSAFELPMARMDTVFDNGFEVMIDFAHTPNALEQILSSIKPKVKGRLIHVFGSAGERDHMKRPEMGKVSAKYANVIILTSEDPRSESQETIIGQIETGINNKKITVLKNINRQEAIDTAIGMARKGDFVLLTGKGHEKSINLGKGEEPWSEYEAVEKALKKAKKET